MPKNKKSYGTKMADRNVTFGRSYSPNRGREKNDDEPPKNSIHGQRVAIVVVVFWVAAFLLLVVDIAVHF